jgi:rhodanese-related sulfurtransferase
MTIHQQAAAAFFRARLTFQTDVSDVHAALTANHRPAPEHVHTLGPELGGGQRPGLSSERDSDRGPGYERGPEHSSGNGSERDPALVLIDSRSQAAWDQAHIPGAIHLPTVDIPTRAGSLLDPRVPVVAYCWGPGCNGATRAALALSEAGFDAKEMLGGIEYWIREGFPVRTEKGEEIAAPDPLTAPRPADAACGC